MENNKYIIISFNTTTDAMAFEKFCLENNYKGKLISVPKEIESGCGLAWEIKISYDEPNNANIDRENFNLKQEYDNSILEKIEIKKLNEIKDMVNSNNLKFDKIVIFEKTKKK